MGNITNILCKTFHNEIRYKMGYLKLMTHAARTCCGDIALFKKKKKNSVNDLK